MPERTLVNAREATPGVRGGVCEVGVEVVLSLCGPGAMGSA